MNNTRKGPWLSGLAAALVVTVVLILTAAANAWHVLSDYNGAIDTDTVYTP